MRQGHASAGRWSRIEDDGEALSAAAHEPVAQRPAKPQWDVGPQPSHFARFLMRLAGVDYALVRTVPSDEQRQMVVIGWALLAGLAFQFLCVATSLAVAFGTDARTIAMITPVAALICAVLFGMDTQLVSADWSAQGMALARSFGIVEDRGPVSRLRRLLSMAAVSYTHLRAHETGRNLVCRLLLE